MYYCLKLVEIAAWWKDLYCYKPDLELFSFFFFLQKFTVTGTTLSRWKPDTIFGKLSAIPTPICSCSAVAARVWKTDSGWRIRQRKNRQKRWKVSLFQQPLLPLLLSPVWSMTKGVNPSVNTTPSWLAAVKESAQCLNFAEISQCLYF